MCYWQKNETMEQVYIRINNALVKYKLKHVAPKCMESDLLFMSCRGEDVYKRIKGQP